MRAELDDLFSSAKNGPIEDGMANAVTETLPKLLSKYGDSLVAGLLSTLDAKHLSGLVAAEVLKTIGETRHGVSHSNRLWILEHALSSPSPAVRDGAGLGLARLGDPAALTYLRTAIQAENNHEIRADLQLVADELAG